METRKGLLEREDRLPGTAQLKKLLIPARVSLPPRQREPHPPRLPMISVIIPAHNEEAYIRETLAAVNRQNYPRCEVVVVANGCTDRTVALARDYCDRLIVEPEKGLGRARNLGAQLARGDLLVFLDADTILEPDSLDVIAETFTSNYAAGTIKGVPDSRRWIYRVLYLCKNVMHRWSIHQGSAGVILCWKEDFEAVGGFDEALQVMENSDLINRLQIWGKYRFVRETCGVTSMRRYERRGAARTAALWVKLWLQSWYSDLRYRDYETVR